MHSHPPRVLSAGLSPDAVQSVILRALECLPSEERRELLLKLAGAEAVDAQEQNELLMSLLRFLCDEKQRSHTHVTAGQPPARWGGRDGIQNAAADCSGTNRDWPGFSVGKYGAKDAAFIGVLRMLSVLLRADWDF